MLTRLENVIGISQKSPIKEIIVNHVSNLFIKDVPQDNKYLLKK